MNTSAAWLTAELHARAARPRRQRLRGDRGEGVISAAIAVLIMAFLGALMWAGFSTLWRDTQKKVECNVNQVGAAAPAAGAAPNANC